MEQSERRAFTVWFSIFADLRGLILATSLASLLALTCSTARADLLLYDGFATATDAQSRTPYLSTSDTHKLTDANAKGAAWTTGLSSSDPWSDASAVVFTFRNNGLSLPDAFADGTGDQFTARGGSVGWLNSSYSSEIRGKNRKITSAIPTSGTLYYRCLMKIETAAFSKMKDYADCYAAAGLTCRAAENKYDNGSAMTQAGFRVRFVGTGSTVALHFDVGKGDGNGMTENTLIGSVTAGTTYLCIVGIDYSEGTACAYAAPIADYDKSFAWTVEDVDASGITGSAVQTMFVDGNYQTNGGRVLVDEIAAGTELGDVAVYTPSGAPQLGTVSLARTGAATYSVSAEESENTADTMSWIANDGASVPATNSFATAVVAGTTETGTISNLTADKTYQISVLAENANGADEKTAGVIYTGALSLGATTDASENGLVAGTVAVSRDSNDPFPLVVNYTISSSAAGAVEGTTWEAPSAVTIPAGEKTGYLLVTPLLDSSVTENIEVTVTLAAGNYEMPTTSAKTLQIINLVAPTGYNTWIATADGLASVDSNWSAGHAPLATEQVLFDGRFSTADCEWDAAASATVASWTQNADYTGTVEIQTTYASGAFPLLSIVGDCVVNGGKWTHASNTNVANNASAQYRLNVSVGGDFTLGSGAKIDLIGRGYNVGRCPSGSEVGVHAATGRGTYSAIYGNVYAPEEIGSGGESDNNNTSSGGGAVKLAVKGAAVIDGTIAANACSQRLNGNNPEKGYGAGGSVFITAGSISGSGIVDVSARPNGLTETAYTDYPGSGGRMALVATSGEVSIPFAKLRANGSVGSYSAGAGTIFVKNSTDANGSLLVGNDAVNWSFKVRYVRKDGCTCVKPGETWTFDHVYVRDSGILSVPANATLSLPGGFESVSSLTDSSTPFCGILYLGGTIALPAREEHVLSSGWMFMAAEPFTINGDVRLSSHASIGSFQLYADSVAAYPACTVTVTGDMTVESEASLYAKSRGRRGSDESPDTGYHGGSVASGTRHLLVYDSILYPTLGGTGGRSKGDMGNTNPGGGAIVLTVGGALTLNGNADAGTSAVSGDHHRGGAGTINITAGTIAGAGSIAANGANGTSGSTRGAGGGGRVAVRLTDAGATFANFSGSITAEGNNANSKSLDYGSSAGTVYLQDGNTANGAGTIKVANLSGCTATGAKTGFPSLSNGEPIDDLTNAKLEISNNSTVILIADVKMSGLEIASGSKLDLYGKKLTVKSAKVGDTKLAPGTYAADNAAVSGFVADSGEGGKLVVTATGLSIIIR